MKFLCTLYFFIISLLLVPLTGLAAPPVGAVKFVILQPTNSTVGTPVTVTIEARKQNNQVDTAYQNDVTLGTSGSATGGGLVDIVNGVGIKEINDSVAETVTLSLSDTESTGLDVDSTREVVFAPIGGGAVWNQIKFLFRDDDGDEVTATGFGAENVNQNANIINVAPGTAVRLRFAIKLTAADGSITPQLEFKQGADCSTGSWTAITSGSNNFSFLLSDNFADGAPTTQQLVGDPNFIAGQILESTNPAASLSMVKNESTEYEWSVKISSDISYGTTYSFRVSNDGGTLESYDQCPSLTIQSQSPKPIGGGRKVQTRPTTVTFSGKAYPGSKVLVVDKENFSERISLQNLSVTSGGDFYVSFEGIMQSQHSFGLVIKDKEGRNSQTKFFNIDTFANNLTEKNIIAPPTIGLYSRLVTRGSNLIVEGYSSPGSNVIITIDDKIVKEVFAGQDGLYKAEIATGYLDFGYRQIKARQKIIDETSDFSPTTTFNISTAFSPQTDLNKDDKVDIKDWSIFLSMWANKNSEDRKTIDINGDSRINISDFSIFIKSLRK